MIDVNLVTVIHIIPLTDRIIIGGVAIGSAVKVKRTVVTTVIFLSTTQAQTIVNKLLRIAIIREIGHGRQIHRVARSGIGYTVIVMGFRITISEIIQR